MATAKLSASVKRVRTSASLRRASTSETSKITRSGTSKINRAQTFDEDLKNQNDNNFATSSANPSQSNSKATLGSARNVALIRKVYQATRKDLEEIRNEKDEGISRVSLKRLSNLVKDHTKRTSIAMNAMNAFKSTISVKNRVLNLLDECEVNIDPVEVMWQKLVTKIESAWKDIRSKCMELGVQKDDELQAIEELKNHVVQAVEVRQQLPIQIDSMGQCKTALECCKTIEKVVVCFLKNVGSAAGDLDIVTDLKCLQRETKTAILNQLIYAADWSIMTDFSHMGTQVLNTEQERLVEMRDVMIFPDSHMEWARHANLFELEELVATSSKKLEDAFLAASQSPPAPEQEAQLMELEDVRLAERKREEEELAQEMRRMEEERREQERQWAEKLSEEKRRAVELAEQERQSAEELAEQRHREEERMREEPAVLAAKKQKMEELAEQRRRKEQEERQREEERLKEEQIREELEKQRPTRTLIVDTGMDSDVDEDMIDVDLFSTFPTLGDQVGSAYLGEAKKPLPQRHRLRMPALSPEVVKKLDVPKQAWADPGSPSNIGSPERSPSFTHARSPTTEMVRPTSRPGRSFDQISVVWHRSGRPCRKARTDPMALSARARIACTRVML